MRQLIVESHGEKPFINFVMERKEEDINTEKNIKIIKSISYPSHPFLFSRKKATIIGNEF